jgi:hypothetical protein
VEQWGVGSGKWVVQDDILHYFFKGIALSKTGLQIQRELSFKNGMWINAENADS